MRLLWDAWWTGMIVANKQSLHRFTEIDQVAIAEIVFILAHLDHSKGLLLTAFTQMLNPQVSENLLRMLYVQERLFLFNRDRDLVEMFIVLLVISPFELWNHWILLTLSSCLSTFLDLGWLRGTLLGLFCSSRDLILDICYSILQVNDVLISFLHPYQKSIGTFIQTLKLGDLCLKNL